MKQLDTERDMVYLYPIHVCSYAHAYVCLVYANLEEEKRKKKKKNKKKHSMMSQSG
jgi:hypothetical protein